MHHINILYYHYVLLTYDDWTLYDGINPYSNPSIVYSTVKECYWSCICHSTCCLSNALTCHSSIIGQY